MSARHHNPIKQLERIDIELAALREQRTGIEARIATLKAERKAGVLEIASQTLSRLDLSQVSVPQLLARLESLNDVDHDEDDTATTADPVRGDCIKAFVKLSRNTTKENRALLESSSLRWNGRAAGWTGSIGSAELARLHLVFKDRVTPQPMIDAGVPPAPSQESAANPIHADETQGPAQAEPDMRETRTDEVEPTAQALVPVMTTLLRGLPMRRAPSSPKEPEYPS